MSAADGCIDCCAADLMHYLQNTAAAAAAAVGAADGCLDRCAADLMHYYTAAAMMSQLLLLLLLLLH